MSDSKIEKLQERLRKNMSKAVELAEKNSHRNEKGEVVLKKGDEWSSEDN
ncbi:hypothetical protein OD350_28775 (plasmid) [Clostridium beijerinckii]|nr:hypothetical protein [Clostridium beijerinckii]UYZ39069.1 hypothetical protein OD350_28775 [Clostridium beijerinckii]